MTIRALTASGILLTAFAACKPHAENGGSNENYSVPQPGSVVTKAVTETNDQLNHFTFSVFVKAGGQSNRGIYEVLAVYGHDTATGQFTMPRGGEHLRPLLRKGDEPSTFIVGFHYGGDTAFYDYYKVSGTHGAISMQYMKGYSFK